MCKPIGIRQLLALAPEKVRKVDKEKKNIRPFCRQHWICPWCSIRGGAKPLVRVYRELLPVIGQSSQHVWHLVEFETKLTDTLDENSLEAMRSFQARVSDRRTRLTRSCREGKDVMAFASRIRYVPVRENGKPTGLGAIVRMALLAKDGCLKATRLPDNVRRLAESGTLRQLTRRGDDWIAAGVHLARYPWAVLFSNPIDLSMLQLLKKKLGRAVTASVSAGDVFRLARLVSTPETEDTAPPPETA